MAVRVKLTGSQHAEVAPLLEDYAAGGDVKVGKSVLTIVDDNDAPDVLNALREGHAAHTGDVGARRALAIAIRKLAEEIGESEESTEDSETAAPPAADETPIRAEQWDSAVKDDDGTTEHAGVTYPTPDTAPEAAAEHGKHLHLVDDTGETESEPETAAQDGVGEPEQPADDETPDLPDSVRQELRRIRMGEYGTQAKELIEGMDTREGERATRWLGRLRHRLYSAQQNKAGEAVQIIKAAV